MASKASGLRDYNEVAERVEGFNELHPDGRVGTSYELLNIGEDPYIVVKAEVYKRADNPVPDATGLSWMRVPGATNFTRGSELENTETSAVGRALAFIGFYAKGESLASKQEIAAKGGESKSSTKTRSSSDSGTAPEVEQDAEKDVVGKSGLTDKQKALLFATLREAKVPDDQRKELVHTITGKWSTKEMDDNDLDLVLTFAKDGEFKAESDG